MNPEHKDNDDVLARMSNLVSIYSSLTRVNETIARVREPHRLYQEVCRIMVDEGKFSAVWIGVVDARTRMVKPIAGWGDKGGYLDVALISLDSPPEEREPAAAAIAERRQQVRGSIADVQHTATWRNEALKRGFSAAASFPIPLEHSSSGALTLYTAQSSLLSDEVVSLLERLADDISLAVETIKHDDQRRKAEKQLAETASMYRSLIEQLPVIAYISAINETGSTLYVSPQIETILGFRLIDWMCDPDYRIKQLHPDDRERVLAKWEECRASEEPVFIEYRMLARDGHTVWFRDDAIVARDEHGAPIFRQGLMLDITEQKEAEQQLFFNAFHDSLTGLANRTLFLNRLELAFNHSKRNEGHSFAVLCLDLDRFKIINDSLGHVVGDQLILDVSDRISKLLRATDTIARLGGDEFAILVDDIKGVSDAIHVAERVRKELSEPFHLEGREVFVTSSIGIALNDAACERHEFLLRDADAAMYRAKKQGKDRFEIFSPAIQQQALSILEMEHDLRNALEREEFQVYYQPIVSLRNNAIIGSEALLRWKHPGRGFVSPADFIPVAEDCGQIVPIGEWILKAACAQNKAWQEAGMPKVTVSVNLSARQFRDNLLMATIERALSDSGLDPTFLKLELTESCVMENAEKSIEMLRNLRDIGVQVAIDDFGTGYSSLAYLKRFPINTLKIDRSFIKDIPASADDAAIAATTIAMAHTLRLDVTAEGVETAEQMAFLQSQQCDYMQGYYFSRPVPAADFAVLLEKQR